MDSQTQDIVTWAEKQGKPSHRPAYKRMTDADRVLALQMAERGISQTDIAQQLGFTQSAISLWLAQCRDTKSHASSYLSGQALRMARNIVKNGLARDHIQALNGLGVLNQQDTGRVSITINGLTLHGTRPEPAIDATFASEPQALSGDIHKLSDETGSDN